MAVDLTTPQARIAQHFMRDTKGLKVAPFEVEQLQDRTCWYFYYDLPQGTLELEVFYDDEIDDWEVSVTGFPSKYG